MKNIFSVKLYLQGLRKVRTAGVAMGIIITVLNAWIPIQCLAEGARASGPIEVEAGFFAPFGFVLMLFAPLLVYNTFSYMNERRSSDFFHSLPQKRICVYLSFMAAVMTWIVSVLCASALVNTILWGMASGYFLETGAVLLMLLGFLLLAMVMAGFMMLAMTLTGTAVANVLVFFLFALFIRSCGLFFLYGFSDLTPMANMDNSFLRIFRLDFYLPIGLFVQIFDGGSAWLENVWFFLYWFFVAVVLLAVSADCYCRRRSESASKSAPNRFMQNIYRIGVTLPFLLFGVYWRIMDGESYVTVLCGIVGFLVWVVFELLTTKKIKNVIRTLPLFLVPVILAGGYAASVRLASDAFYANTPERDQIKGAIYESQSVGGLLNAVMNATEVQDPDVLDHVYEAIEQTKESRDWTWSERNKHGYTQNATVTVILRSGRRVTYDLTSSIDLFQAFRYADEVIAEGLSINRVSVERISLSVNISDTQKIRVWEAFLADMESLTDDELKKYMRLNETIGSKKFNITVMGYYEDIYLWQSYFLDKQYTPKAVALLMEFYEEKDPVGELREIVSEISQAKSDEIFYANMIVYEGSEIVIYHSEFDVIKEFLMSLELDSHLTDYANSEYIYRFVLEIQWNDFSVATDAPMHSGSTYDDEKYETVHGIFTELYLTLSKEDIERFHQISQYPAVPAN